MQTLYYSSHPFSNYEAPIAWFLLWSFGILTLSGVTETVFQYVLVKIELIKCAKPAHLLIYIYMCKLLA